MTKKEMQSRIESLERELSELKSQMLSLALRPVFNSFPVYVSAPPIQPSYPQPSFPQPNWPGNTPIITCEASSGSVQ
jgi:hypothetical protein